MSKPPASWNLICLLAHLVIIMMAGSNMAQARSAGNLLEHSCIQQGWQRIDLRVDGMERRLLWKGPKGSWKNGAILVLHGGGGQADHFCAGGNLVQPQIQFTTMALERGFAVFALEATDDIVTDSEGRPCGKRFDFSVLGRKNIDLPYIERIITETVPALRPAGSNPAIFVTGLSTGGYMATRIAGELGRKITAAAPISSGDPYGTDTICDASLSKRTSAKGILVDRETHTEIVQDNACASGRVAHEAPWPKLSENTPPVKQFHNEADGLVDISCMRKATKMLQKNGFPVNDPYVIPKHGWKSLFKHLWLEEYNAPLLDFFARHATQSGT